MGNRLSQICQKKLTKLYGKGFDRVSIYRYVKFFQTFPEIVSTLDGTKEKPVNRDGLSGRCNVMCHLSITTEC